MEIQKNKRNVLSLRDKLEIIRLIERGEKNQRELCAEKDLPRSTVATIWSTRQKIKSANTIQGIQDGCKRLRQPRYEEVDQALYRWYLYAREKDEIITTSNLLEKAIIFAASLGIENYKCSTGWLDRFKLRHGIKLRDTVEKCEDDGDNRNSWLVNKLPTLIANTYPHDVYAVTDIGLLYHVVPQENQIMGGYCNITNEHRVTLLLGSNMDGTDKLPPLVIGSSMGQTNMETSDIFSISYSQDPNSLITAQIWLDWIRTFDQKMRSMKRKVILFIDACPSHFVVKNLRAVSVHFVPVNCKHLMPIKHGIMQHFKAWYRKVVLRDMAHAFNDGFEFHVDMLSALHYVRTAWGRVSPDCIRNAFNVAGWIPDNDFDIEPMPPLPAVTHECLQLNISESIFEHVSQEEEVMVTREELTDKTIIESVTAQSEISIYTDVDIDTSINMDHSHVVDSAKSPAVLVENSEAEDRTNSQETGIAEAKAAIETITSFINAMEKEKNESPPEKKAKKRRVKKKKAKVMSLCPEKGIFEIQEMKLEIE